MNVEEKVKGILCELSGLESVDNDLALQEDLALDSLDMVSLLINIEDDFDIQLDESDMNPFDLQTVNDVIILAKKYGGSSDEKSS